MEKSSILLVENQQQDIEVFQELWENETIQVFVYNDSFAALQKIKSEKQVHWILLVSERATPLKAAQIKEYLKDMQFHISVFEVLEPGAERKENAVIPQMVKPFTTNTKRVIDLFIGKKPPVNSGPKKYGLGYLQDVSQNNEEFISEMLSAFVKMVGEKIDELVKFSVDPKEEDIFAIKQIAHTLKPSFEMVESYTGKELCHVLFYEAKITDVPARILELKKEYEGIVEEIKNDYPDKILT